MGKTEKFSTKNYDLNPNSKKGVMLIHGFTSTTYEMLPLAHFLELKGYRVVLDNLPGHGTTIEDCNLTKYPEWISFVEQRFAELSGECDELYIVGFSMGAILGLYLASLFPINKLVIATNKNDILKRVVKTGVYKPKDVVHTISPSMDIQVASNFERLLFDIFSNDSNKILRLMNDLNQKGEFKLEKENVKKISEHFSSESLSEDETKLVIK